MKSSSRPIGGRVGLERLLEAVSQGRRVAEDDVAAQAIAPYPVALDLENDAVDGGKNPLALRYSRTVNEAPTTFTAL